MYKYAYQWRKSTTNATKTHIKDIQLLGEQGNSSSMFLSYRGGFWQQLCMHLKCSPKKKMEDKIQK